MTKRLSLGLVTGMTIALVAAVPVRNALSFQPESRIWVSGKSSVKDFKCQAKTIEGNLRSASDVTDGVPLAKLVSVAEVGVQIAALDCGNGTMNEHMRKALKATEFPRIAFRMSSYEIGTADDVTIRGDLTIAGKEMPVVLSGKVTEQGEAIKSSATADIDMTKWGVKPPSLMLGTMKVKPVVTIGYDVAIKR
jgi:polyisoprenoid-binding protein YceI